MKSERPNPRPYFLPELQIEVLLRLPVKSLVRFISVSKTWHSLIKNSTFICEKINLSHENAADNQRLFVRRLVLYEPEPTLSMHENNDNFCQNYVNLEIPPSLSAEEKKRPASRRYNKTYVSDGEILCIFSRCSFILWNPSINKTVKLPCCNEKENLNWSIFGFGFGFDAKANDYKVVRIGCPMGTTPLLKKRAQVFSLRQGCWRDIVGELAQHAGFCPINFNGFVHWMITYCDDPKGINWILTFDLSDKEFGKIVLPNILARQRACAVKLTVFGKSISLFNYDNTGVTNICSLWMMKEKDVWTEMWSYSDALGKPLGFRLNGELLVGVDEQSRYGSHYGELYSFNLKTQKRRKLGLQGYAFQVDEHVESLALFDY